MEDNITRIRASVLSGAAYFMVAGATQASTIYTNDKNLADLTSGVTIYATFLGGLNSDLPVPFAPSATTLSQGLRVFGKEKHSRCRAFPIAFSDSRLPDVTP